MNLLKEVENLKEDNIKFIDNWKTTSFEIIDKFQEIMKNLQQNIQKISDELNKMNMTDENNNNNYQNYNKNLKDFIQDMGIDDINQNENNIIKNKKYEDKNSLRKTISRSEIIEIEKCKISEITQENTTRNEKQDTQENTNNTGFRQSINVINNNDPNSILNYSHSNKEITENQIDQKTQLVSQNSDNKITDHLPEININDSKIKKSEDNEEELDDLFNINLMDDIIFELKNHPDIGIVINKEGNILHYNYSFISQLKFTSSECININIKSLIHFDDHEIFMQTFKNFLSEVESKNSNSYDSKNKLNIQFKPITVNISDKFQEFSKFKLSFEITMNNNREDEENDLLIKIRLLKYFDEDNYFQISPTSTYYFIWSIIILILLIQILWDTTQKLSFGSVIINENSQIITLLVTFVFSVDFILNFFLGYEISPDVIEVKIENIIQNYLTSQFIIDLISTIPFELLENVQFRTQNLKLIKFVRIFKLFRLAKVQPKINSLNFLMKLEQFSEIALFVKANIGFIELIKVISFLFVLTHFQTCLYFYYKTEILENNNLNWTYLQFQQKYENRNAINIQMKVQSEMLKTSLGLNSVQASDTQEIFLDTSWIIIGLSIFGQGIGNISSQLTNANKRENELSETLKFFHELQEEHECEQLSKLIEQDIRDQYNNYSINEFYKYSQLLSDNMKTQIEFAIQSDFIKLDPIFNSLNIKSVKKLKQCKLKSDKYILRSNEVIHSCYFVFKGSIKIMNSNLCMVNEQFPGEIFGMSHFTEQQSKKYNIDLDTIQKKEIIKKSKKMTKHNESIHSDHKNLQNKLSEHLNDNLLMLQNDITIKCDYYAICGLNDNLYLEINYNILEEILKTDIDSFIKIYKNAMKSLELINENEQKASQLVIDQFENSNMIGIMVKKNGQIQSYNIESKKQINELNCLYHDLNCQECIHKIDNGDYYSISDLNDIVLGYQKIEINYKKYQLELSQIDEVKIARTDLDSFFYKLKKSLVKVKVLYFNKQ